MPTNFTPDGETAQSPASIPNFDDPVVLALPVGVEGHGSTAHYQPLKALAERLELFRKELRWQRGMVFRDDFIAGARADVWSTATGAATDSLIATRVYELDSGESLATPNIGLATRDFRIRARVLLPSIDGTSVADIGIVGGTNKVAFTNSGTTEWRARIDGSVVAPDVSSAAGLSSPPYAELEILRVGGLVFFFVDGTLVYDQAYATSLNDPVKVTHTNTGQTRVDWIELAVA